MIGKTDLIYVTHMRMSALQERSLEQELILAINCRLYLLAAVSASPPDYSQLRQLTSTSCYLCNTTVTIS